MKINGRDTSTAILNLRVVRRYDDDYRLVHCVDDQPVETEDGELRWYKDGMLHRENGPAVVYQNGDGDWYCNGRPHRTDGPSFSNPIGWFIGGVRITTTKQYQRKAKLSDEELAYIILKFGDIS